MDPTPTTAKALSSTPSVDTDELWRIHGELYDLRPFLERHPGGAQVLLSVRGKDDLTAAFESSHVFTDRSRVEWTMRKFRWALASRPP